MAARLQSLNPDVGVVLAYGRVIPGDLLTRVRHGMVGLHPSLLPKYRGAAPIAWAIVNGDSMTGVTTFRLNDQLDAGEVLLQDPVPIEPRETTVTLSERLAKLGGSLLVKTLAALEQGSAASCRQDDRQASYARKLSKDDGRLDWTQPALVIDRTVRGMMPWPGAWTTWKGQTLKLWVVTPHDEAIPSARPGAVMKVDPAGLTVATGAGQIIIHELQLAGGRQMTAEEFLRGHPMQVGECLS
jgi:methionyl-tRNA formyltransferase